MTEPQNPQEPEEIQQKPIEVVGQPLPLGGSRPRTNNWLSRSFLWTCCSWSLVSVLCLLNFMFAAILVSEGEWAPAIFNGIYGLLIVWIFGATLLGAPMVFLAVKELEKRNFIVAERILARYLKLVKGLRLYRDGYYTVAVSNLALIKLAGGDYHHAELLYEELIGQVKKKKRQAKHSLTAIYINNLACVKVAQACSHEELFELELQEAERLARESLAIWQGSKGEKTDERGAAYPLQVLAEIDILRGHLQDAEAKLNQAIKLNGEGKNSLFILPENRQGLYFENHFWLALLYLKQGKKAQADTLCQRLIGEQRARPAPVFEHSMAVLNRLASQYLELAAWTEAESVLEFAYLVARGYPMHPEAHEIAHSFERLLLATDRKEEIADMKLWIRPVLELGQEQP